MAAIFSTPLPTHQRHQFASSSRKRKRNPASVEEEEHHDESDSSVGPHALAPEEYTAVISPQAREQRRLAQYSLTQPLPPPPFPHAPRRGDDGSKRKAYTRNSALFPSDPTINQGSLRSQHLAAMTAVLHKCLQKKDYSRASRALGLILRTDIDGKPVDIRAANNWSIGAEILLQRDAHERRQQSNKHGHMLSSRCQTSLPFTRHGFEQAKALYENLIIQHPYSKSWPDRVNAIDFYLAMFSLWIYVAQAEATQQQDELDADQSSHPSVDYLSRLQDTKLSQLRQANEIERRMDSCMGSVPYKDNRDLLRMRAMLALWRADLNSACVESLPISVDKGNETSVPNTESVADGVGSLRIQDGDALSSNQMNQAALEARKFARQTVHQLGIAWLDDD